MHIGFLRPEDCGLYRDNIYEKDFPNRDSQQLRMGLKEIKTKMRSKVIFNNSDFESYFQSFLKSYPKVSLLSNEISPPIPKERPIDLGESILIALLNEVRYLTTTEITHQINNCFPNSCTVGVYVLAQLLYIR